MVEEGVTGYMVPSRDPDALADALEKLALDPELRRCQGTAGRARFLEKFQFDRCEEHLVEIFHKVMQADGSARERAAASA
jgi:glycosyltransferase involved in cell wall biosynthesis